MDSFMNLAKQGYEAYSQSQGGGDSDARKTGGEEYNSPHNSGQQGGQGRPQFNEDEVVQTAQNHGGGDSSLFSSALGFVHQNKSQHDEPVDEEAVQSAHQQAYHEGGAGNLDASSMGSAAALQTLKKFTSGGGGGGGSQNQLISMAMAEAGKLFDQSGGASGGNKQDAVNGAAMTVMKLLVQSKFSSMTGGGSSGGIGSLLSMASKFA
ncbi:hypothetical protein FA95DRAFT_1553520 [Auriscalpium vulgare]|uniref:Uncharacterized protein n=1 Tax=Auriscalpium vulgare TaxID=40419 RepID=A0ACB8S9A2_9AGAM|nr:hypothetical protein FA95DRAFT_1553520 [Auriscalpium vulgare]